MFFLQIVLQKVKFFLKKCSRIRSSNATFDITKINVLFFIVVQAIYIEQRALPHLGLFRHHNRSQKRGCGHDWRFSFWKRFPRLETFSFLTSLLGELEKKKQNCEIDHFLRSFTYWHIFNVKSRLTYLEAWKRNKANWHLATPWWFQAFLFLWNNQWIVEGSSRHQRFRGRIDPKGSILLPRTESTGSHRRRLRPYFRGL